MKDHRGIMKKYRSQRIHAKKRFCQRFGLDLTSGSLSELARQIRDGEAEFVFRQSNRVSVWDVTYQKRTFRVIYDGRTKEIVTVLPEDSDLGPYAQGQKGEKTCQEKA